MNRLAIGAIMVLAAIGPALAQPGAAPARPAATSPPATTPPATTPPTGTAPPGPANTPPTTTPAVPEIVTVEPPPVANQPAPPPPPPEVVDIPLRGDYPNGFQDPADPFANSVRADNDREAGFPWGLVGLLGLLGLVPLVRGHGHRNAAAERERTVIRRNGE